MKKNFAILVFFCLCQNMVVSQISESLHVSLLNNTNTDTIGFFDRLSLILDIKNLSDSPVLIGKLQKSMNRSVLPIRIEYRIENDTMWHDYEPIFGKFLSIYRNDFVVLEPLQEINSIPVELSAYLFLSQQPNIDISRKNYFNIYIRVSYTITGTIIRYQSNDLKIVLHNYSSSPFDYNAFLYLMRSKKPGIIAPCFLEHYFSPCVSVDSNDILILDTLIALYPKSKFTAWAHAILAIKYLHQEINIPYDTIEDSNTGVIDLGRIEPDLARLRRVKKHVKPALSANNPEIKRELSLWGLDSADYFKNRLGAIFYSKYSISRPIPLELVNEFAPNK